MLTYTHSHRFTVKYIGSWFFNKSLKICGPEKVKTMKKIWVTHWTRTDKFYIENRDSLLLLWNLIYQNMTGKGEVGPTVARLKTGHKMS